MGTFSYYLTLGTICIALVGATSAAVQFGDASLQSQGVPMSAAAAVADAAPPQAQPDVPAEARTQADAPASRARPRYRTVRGF